MKYLDEYRDAGRRGRLLARDRADAVTRPWTIMEVCGGQTHTDRQVRHRRAAAAGGRAGPRAGLPGVRDAAGDDRPGHAIAAAAGRDLLLVRRHAPRARRRRRPVRSQGGRRRRPGRLLAARRREPRGGEPGPEGRVLRHRLRDDRPGQRHGRVAGEAARADELQRAGLARPGAAGDGGHPRVAGQPRAGVPGGRATSARSWARAEYEPIGRRATGCRSSSPGSSRWTCSKGCCAASSSWRRAGTEVENPYARAVRPEATRTPGRWSRTCSRSDDRKWRGIGTIPHERLPAAARVSRPRRRDAVRVWATSDGRGVQALHQRARSCKGLKKPHDCPAFGRECTPQTPLGATMVSSEGACAAYYDYGRLKAETRSEPAHGAERASGVERSTRARRRARGDHLWVLLIGRYSRSGGPARRSASARARL